MASTTVVGESVLITGTLEGDEDLTVLGRIEGQIRLSKMLVVGDSGVVKADVQVCNAVVSGVVVGNINASDSVEVTETGRLQGDICAPRVIVVAGARIRGRIDMGNLAAYTDTPALSTSALDTPALPAPRAAERSAERTALTRTAQVPIRRLAQVPVRHPISTPPQMPARRPEPFVARTQATAPAQAATPAPFTRPAAAPTSPGQARPDDANQSTPPSGRKLKKRIVVQKER